MSASKHKLSNLVVLLDYNKIQSYDFVKDVLNLEPFETKGGAGFEVSEVNGHDVNQLKKALNQISSIKDKPKIIICHTIKGKGIAFAENNPSWHHKNNLGKKELEDLNNSIK